MPGLKSKQLSNPFSTGGGGHHFESQVQASFLALMLSGGRAPHLPEGVITSIKLQGKVDGYEVDDFIITTKNQRTGETEKLLGQVKHSVAITAKDTTFREVIFAAWSDYNNEKLFRQEVDKIAMITGPLSKTDQTGLKSILQQARCTSNHEEFFRNIERGNFVSQNARDKITILRNVLSEANSSVALADKDMYGFLRHFYWIGYDLGTEEGVVQSLLLSHIVQFKVDNPLWLWGRLLNITQTRNQSSGTLTLENLPNDVRDAFSPINLVQIPKELNQAHGEPSVGMNFEHINSHPDASYLAKVLLLGSWNENYEGDRQLISQFLDLNYSEWQKKARAIVILENSPLSFKNNGDWTIVNKKELWKNLALHLFNDDIEKICKFFVTVIKDYKPVPDLPPAERMYAFMHDKPSQYSFTLRDGMSEGLAILSNMDLYYKQCSRKVIRKAVDHALDEIFNDVDWKLWASFSYLLPTMAEVSPKVFLSVIEKSLLDNKKGFQDFFAHKSFGIVEDSYLVSILWALESLAWAEDYFTKVCANLADLASMDSTKQELSLPVESLKRILLPWCPQTYATMGKQQVVMKTLFLEHTNIAWKVLLALLPHDSQNSYSTHKPKYLLDIAEEYIPQVSTEEYVKQITFYINLAFDNLNSLKRFEDMFPYITRFPKTFVEIFIGKLENHSLISYSQNEIDLFGTNVRDFIKKSRRSLGKNLALAKETLDLLEKVVQGISPQNKNYYDKELFSSNKFDYLDEENLNSDYIKNNENKRLQIIQEILNQDGFNGILEFSKTIQNSYLLGISLSRLPDLTIEQNIIPGLLFCCENMCFQMVTGFIFQKFESNGWNWVMGFSFGHWMDEQVVSFFLRLPFIEEVWRKIESNFPYIEQSYWETVKICYNQKMNLDFAIEKFLYFNRPNAATKCLSLALHNNYEINHILCSQALISVLTTPNDNQNIEVNEVALLIKNLQTCINENFDALCKIEFAYIKLFRFAERMEPVALMTRIASNPTFFCEIIQTVYVAKGSEIKKHISKTEEKNVEAAWNLLQICKIIPGTQANDEISFDNLISWFSEVKSICVQSGHLDIALSQIGKILSHAPCDPSGLWIHKAVARVLNMPDGEIMRNAFENEIWHYFGRFIVEATGQHERLLAEKYRKKADEVENEGFYRLAVTIRNLAESYELDAQETIEHFAAMRDSNNCC